MKPKPINPFVFDAANTLDDDTLLDFYIDDHNNNKVLKSKRNVFLIGERGSGKSMSLLFNSFKLQKRLASLSSNPPEYSFIGVVVPCNTPLTHRNDHLLLPDFLAGRLSEHYLATSIAHAIVATLADSPELIDPAISANLREGVMQTTELVIPETLNPFRAIARAIDNENILAQQKINEGISESLYQSATSFYSLVLPLLRIITEEIPLLKGSHFSLMLDDIHDLNEHQKKILNSWVAYRDRTLFSLKLASTKIGRPDRITASGGTILEGHDYVTIDLEQPLHNTESNYGQLAKKIIERRLVKIGASQSAEEFFPEHPALAREIELAGDRIRKRRSDLSGKQLSDYVYKQRWAEYSRTRPAKSNLPLYSGFTTLAFLSTGVIRNLLEPCWWMFDDQLSRQPDQSTICAIDPSIQAHRIIDRSKVAWAQLERLDHTMVGCTTEHAKQVYQLFENLAQFFLARLMGHASEPSANSFGISEQTPEIMEKLLPLLDVAQRAQLLYTREGSAKNKGKRELYYVPNRILWPVKGLDPHGQHGRVQIKARVLLEAANGKPISFVKNEDPDTNNFSQGELF